MIFVRRPKGVNKKQGSPSPARPEPDVITSHLTSPAKDAFDFAQDRRHG